MKNHLIILVLLLFAFSCNDAKYQQQETEISTLKIELDSLKQSLENSDAKNKKIYSFMTFQKEDAEKAMNMYVNLFENSEIIKLEHWDENEPGKAGTIKKATFSLDGKMYMCSDSPPIHKWDFSPAISNFVECKDNDELQKFFKALSENGQIFMPPGNYGFSQQFSWVVDQFGVSWQLNLK
ncbi:VOC family protein [Winogradskyella tangerina]|uniref:VOC family protein n=1 Tax=Winogradskyella tangerina TaxID=2023240 RepID=UPI001E3ED420|nr:VOC family protein [Winogradskyella tangerina]